MTVSFSLPSRKQLKLYYKYDSNHRLALKTIRLVCAESSLQTMTEFFFSDAPKIAKG